MIPKHKDIGSFLFWRGPFNEHPIVVEFNFEDFHVCGQWIGIDKEQFKMILCGELSKGPYFITDEGKIGKKMELLG